ncbi:MAG TPA: tetratricopeptide repeat protein, partial [Polyangiaceae bacterium]|nr:tetratricopeptide repeat protein [Polyangiaceae bacterium]
ARAAYLRGVALTKQAQVSVPESERPLRKPDFTAAIAEFQGAYERGKSASDEATRTIAELSLLAVARLYFERGDNRSAARAYEQIPRSSPHFERALFELSWAYVRLGDYERGLRTLQVLRVLEPGLIDGADSALLLADMHLRSGRYLQAEQAYQAVRDKYEPIRRQVEDYLLAHPDAGSNYDALTDVELSSTRALPGLVMEWAREEANEERVFAIVEDIARSRSMLRKGQRSVVLLRAALGGGTRARLFPMARRELELVTGLLNQLAVARLGLARAMDEEAGSGTAEVEAVRKERRALMTRQSQVPTRPGDFSVREANAEKQWDAVGEKLQRCHLEVAHLNALINGLRRTLSDAQRSQIAIEPTALERYRQELATHETELADYEKRIAEYGRDIDMGRVQSGFGDARFVEDEQVRQSFRDLFDRETALVAAGGDGEAKDYAGSIKPLLSQLRSAETDLETTRQKLEAVVSSLSEETSAVVEAEAQALESYAARLDTMDEASRTLVGEVARDNLARVQRRLQGVVLRADVGAIQKSWEKRENQRFRVRDLQRERAREETLINEELREVLDDSEETQ